MRKGIILLIVLIFLIQIVHADVYNGLNVTLIEEFNMNDLLNDISLTIEGVTTNGTDSQPNDFWITDSSRTSVYWLNGSFINETVEQDTLVPGSSAPEQITTNSTDVWFFDDIDNFFYHFDILGNNISDGFLTIPPTTGTQGIDRNETNFFLVGGSAGEKIIVLNLTYDNVYNISVDISGESAWSVTTNTTDFYIMALSEEIYHLDSSGTQIGYRSLLNVCDYVSNGYCMDFTTSNGEDFWITNANTDNILHITFSDSSANPPVIDIEHPTETTYDSTVVNINYTISDDGDLFECWYSLNEGEINTTITCGNNVTDLDSGEGDFVWTVWGNDTFGNEGSDSVSFTVTLTPPVITLDGPLDGTFANSSSVLFNFTATDLNGLDTCELYENFSDTWNLNYTWVSPNSAVQNETTIEGIKDGVYDWNVLCNDTTSKSNYSLNNFTLTVDTTLPVVSTDDISITTTTGSQTVLFNVTAFTEINCDSTWYSVYLGASIENGLEDKPLTCSDFNSSFTVTDYNTYSLKVYMNDSSGNINSTTKSFTTTQLSGGGGGGGGTTSEFSAVAIKQINATELSKLQRAILYVRTREMCGNRTGYCSLDNDQKIDLISILEEQTVDLTISELNNWLDAYNDELFEGVSLAESEVIRYNLFTAVVEVIGTPFQVYPSTLSPILTLVLFTDNFQYKVTSNKVLKNATIIEGDLGISINLTSDTTADVILEIQDLNFTSRVFKATANYIDEDGESIFQNIALRVVNPKGLVFNFIPLWILTPMVIVILTTIYIKRKYLIKNIKKGVK